MALYADTSFLASYFLPDANSASALASVQALSAPRSFTALHRLELRNALGLAVFRAEQLINLQPITSGQPLYGRKPQVGLPPGSNLLVILVREGRQVQRFSPASTNGAPRILLSGRANALLLGVSRHRKPQRPNHIP